MPSLSTPVSSTTVSSTTVSSTTVSSTTPNCVSHKTPVVEEKRVDEPGTHRQEIGSGHFYWGHSTNNIQ